MIDNGIRNIIFDLGGVILNLDYYRTEKAFIDLGITGFHDLYSQLHASSLFIDLECGRIGTPEFVETLNKHSNIQLSEEQIVTAWNAMLLDFPPSRIRLLKQLKTRYRTFLLSNTNAIHHQAFFSIYTRSVGEGNLEDCFEKAYYSHVIGLRKPNKEAYEFVLTENNLKPEETMFIDDTSPNIDAARLLGIRSVYLQPPQGIENLFL